MGIGEMTKEIIEQGKILKSFECVERMSSLERKLYFEDLYTICKGRKPKKNTNHLVIKTLGKIIPILRNFEIEIEGQDNIPTGKSAIFICNHSNTHDAFIAREVFNRFKKDVTTLVAWDGLNWMSRLIFRLCDCTLIKRDNAESKENGMLDFCSKVISGKNGFIFGEATWNLHPVKPMQNIKAGVTEAALITDAVIIPTIFEYVEVDWLCKKEKELYTKCVVSFGRPYSVSTDKGLFEQTNQLQNIMESMRKSIWEREGVKRVELSDVNIERYINHTYLKKFKAFGFKYDTNLESRFLLRKGQSIENEYIVDFQGRFTPGVIDGQVLKKGQKRNERKKGINGLSVCR